MFFYKTRTAARKASLGVFVDMGTSAPIGRRWARKVINR